MNEPHSIFGASYSEHFLDPHPMNGLGASQLLEQKALRRRPERL